MEEIYKPIMEQIYDWHNYEDNCPKTEYITDRKRHDEFRSKNDLDCILCGGDLKADMIFSLWLPLRFTLVRLNGYEKLNSIFKTTISKTTEFEKLFVCKKIIEQPDMIKTLLPNQNNTVHLLSELFALGRTRANVMILKERGHQERGKKPYYDYMPYFLFECFEGGDFSQAFSSDIDLKNWIEREHLNCFFDKEIDKNSIKDLSGTGDIKSGVPKDIDCLLNNYIEILKDRKGIFLTEENL